MYLGQADTGPTQAVIDNWIAWHSAQPIEVSFGTVIQVASGAKTWGEWYAMPRSGVTKEELNQLATNALAQDAFKKSVGVAVDDEYNDPRWPQLTAAREAERLRQIAEYEAYCRVNQCATIGPGPSTPAPTGGTSPQPIVPTTGITTARTATRDQVIAAFRNTPGANPQPDDAAISYYMGKGVAQLVIDVAAIRKSNPALAAQIDAQRRSMGLPTAGGTATPITPITPVTTPTIGTGGVTTLLLAAAAAYLIGS